MSEIQKIKQTGHQPAAKISDDLLDRLIKRKFEENTAIVKTKLEGLHGIIPERNRVAAGILKLSGNDVGALDGLIEKANCDYRDILFWAEYPRCASVPFGEADRNTMKQIYNDDFVEYSNWLNE